jgi:hypothetical protein
MCLYRSLFWTDEWEHQENINEEIEFVAEIKDDEWIRSIEYRRWCKEYQDIRECMKIYVSHNYRCSGTHCQRYRDLCARREQLHQWDCVLSDE